MKNQILFSSAIALFAMGAMTSCSDKDKDQPQSNEQLAITLTSTIEQTRSTNTDIQKNQLANGVNVGVFVIDSNSSDIAGNALLTADGSGGLSGDAIYFPKEGDVSIYAYAPHNSNWTHGENEFTVKSNQSDDDGYLASDLLYGVPTAATNSFNSSNPSPIALSFAHKLAKVTVTFNADGSDYDLTGKTVNITNTLPTAKLNTTDGTLTAASGTATTIKAATFATDAETFSASAVVVPQTVAAGTEFIQVILGEIALSAKLSSETVFEGGKSYAFTVNVSSMGAEIDTDDTTVTDWTEGQSYELNAEEVEAPELKLTATFGTPGSNASYSDGTYQWTGSTSNLMTVFEFSNGELADYSTLYFTFSNLAEDSSVRMGYYIGSVFTEFGSGYYNDGAKVVDLTALEIDLSTVTSIAFGGRSSTGSCTILPTDVYLVGKGSFGDSSDNNTSNTETGSDENAGTTTGGDNTGTDNGDTLTATFQTPASNASYDGTTYSWTGSTNNLMTIFEFTNGELADYKTLSVKFDDISVGAAVRFGYYIGSSYAGFNDGGGYYENGTKTIDLTSLGIDLSTVDKISFGGYSNSGSCTIVASDCILSK